MYETEHGAVSPSVLKVMAVLCVATLLQAAAPCRVSSATLSMDSVSAGQVIGDPQRHTLNDKETLLDVARRYDLGYNEIQELYPQLDPWVPPRGRTIEVPTLWIVPPGETDGILVNIPELRLYYVDRRHHRFMTFPVSIGEDAWPTPQGRFIVENKQERPVWNVPPSLTHKYRKRFFPPGRDNPLGEYWLGLEDTHYGIHGTDFPWSIGRAVTRGCIRLYPEDVATLFRHVPSGTPVNLIYAPVKIGIRGDRVYVEVHRDIYDRVGSLTDHGIDLLQREGLARRVDLEKYRLALQRQGGMPVDVTAGNTEVHDDGKTIAQGRSNKESPTQ